MEAFLAECAQFWGSNQPLVFSVFIAGIVGSATHCSLMCSPLVAAQMFELKRSQQASWLIGWYHAGRITTYIMLGIAATLAGQWIFGGSLAQLSHLLLLIAGGLFLFSAASPQKTHKCCGSKSQKLVAKISPLVNPRLAYFIRGNLMGFMPCGMVLSVLLLVATTQSPLISAGLMLLFGISTIPALQTAGLAALSIHKRHPAFGAHLGRAMMAVNGSVLCAIGLGAITIH